MRARYYCPQRRRFINSDIIHGDISDSTSLNRYAYVNGNPVSFVDPFGLSAERGGSVIAKAPERPASIPNSVLKQILNARDNLRGFCYYSDNYTEHLMVVNEDNGITRYIFTYVNNTLFGVVITRTEYVFETHSVDYWKKSVNYDVNNIFKTEEFDDFVAFIGDLTPPGSDLPLPVEFMSNVFQAFQKSDLKNIFDVTHHETPESAYIHSKIAGRSSNENVSIIKSVYSQRVSKEFTEDFSRTELVNYDYF